MKNLFELLESFVLVYLPLERGYSKETSKSYYTAIKQFINYLIDTTNIKQEKLSVTDFTRVNISSYLLEIDSQGKSISTRNQRLSALVSFVLYCAMIEPIYQNTLSDVKQIKLKKNIRKKLDYLTVEEYKALISTVDLKSKNGLRHYTILNLLYDTAARVSEFINIKVEDLNYGSNNSIKVYGKGKRYRVIYISDHTVNLIRDYMNKYHITSG